MKANSLRPPGQRRRAGIRWDFARDFIGTGDEPDPTISAGEAEETEGFEDV